MPGEIWQSCLWHDTLRAVQEMTILEQTFAALTTPVVGPVRMQDMSDCQVHTCHVSATSGYGVKLDILLLSQLTSCCTAVAHLLG